MRYQSESASYHTTSCATPDPPDNNALPRLRFALRSIRLRLSLRIITIIIIIIIMSSLFAAATTVSLRRWLFLKQS